MSSDRNKPKDKQDSVNVFDSLTCDVLEIQFRILYKNYNKYFYFNFVCTVSCSFHGILITQALLT